MRKVHLYGSLKKYGATIEMDVSTVGEAVRALCANFPEMVGLIEAGSWRIVRGKTVGKGFAIDLDQVNAMHLGTGDLHFLPVLSGQKSSGASGAIKAIVGVVLIMASFGSAAFLAAPISASLFGSMTYGMAIGQLGLAMTMTGISTALSPQQKSQKSDNSYVMSGPSGAAHQGAALPVIYGEVITGGVMISGSLDIEGLKGPGAG